MFEAAKGFAPTSPTIKNFDKYASSHNPTSMIMGGTGIYPPPGPRMLAHHHQDHEPFLGNPNLNLNLPRLHPGVDPTNNFIHVSARSNRCIGDEDLRKTSETVCVGQ